MYLEDIPEVPGLPDGDPNTWSQYHSTGFVPRFPKIYDMWGLYCKKKCQEHPCTWRTFLSFLIFLMVPEVS